MVSVDEHGEVELDKDCDVKGLVILRDGKVTHAEREVLDLEDVLKAIAQKGIDAPADPLKKAGGKEGDPSSENSDKQPAAE